MKVECSLIMMIRDSEPEFNGRILEVTPFSASYRCGLRFRLLEESTFMRKPVQIVHHVAQWWIDRDKWGVLTDGVRETRLVPEYGCLLYWNLFGLTCEGVTGTAASHVVEQVFKLGELRCGSPWLQEHMPRWYAMEKDRADVETYGKVAQVMDS